MQVTLDVFSGRPNPSWTLADNDLRQLVDRLAGKAMHSIDEVQGELGYRGFIISTTNDAQAAAAKLPESFRVGGLVHQSFVAAQDTSMAMLRPQESDEAAIWLLSTAPKGVVDDEVLSRAESAIKQRAAGTIAAVQQTQQAAVEEKGQTPAAAACVLENTPYNPGFWNTPIVQPHNNCYNFAMNCRSDTFAQPGRISGHFFDNVFQCANVAPASVFDGCTETCSQGNSYKLVALVVWPGHDFHWYRWHPVERFWAHKPGQTAVRNVDNSNQLLTGNLNPYNCNRSPYTDFCGYVYSPTGIQVN